MLSSFCHGPHLVEMPPNPDTLHQSEVPSPFVFPPGLAVNDSQCQLCRGGVVLHGRIIRSRFQTRLAFVSFGETPSISINRRLSSSNGRS